MKFAEYDSPCGRLMLGVHGNCVCLCDWIVGDRISKTLSRIERHLSTAYCPEDVALLDKLKIRLDAYFSGNNPNVDFPLFLKGTPFQRRVWESLRQIPYGTTSTYKIIAESVGVPGGFRAVASAIGANSISILIPCHRVIGSDGSLSGYAGGIEAKSFLLGLEAMDTSIRRPYGNSSYSEGRETH